MKRQPVDQQNVPLGIPSPPLASRRPYCEAAAAATAAHLGAGAPTAGWPTHTLWCYAS